MVNGWAEFQDAKTVKVGKGKDALIIEGENVILANGSVPVELPFMKYGNNVISSRSVKFARITRTCCGCWRGYQWSLNNLQNVGLMSL